jgi:hypothetical protein
VEGNEEPRELGLEVGPLEVGPDEGALTAEIEALRQNEEVRAAEVEALRAELADAQRGQVDAHRRAILAEHAGQIVEELVAGSTVAELDASLDTARAAYGRALESARRELGATVVPVGASPRLEPSPEELSPIAKITAALSRR